MLDPAACGPATLAFCQDTQTEAWRLSRRPVRAPRLAHPPPGPRSARDRRRWPSRLRAAERAADHRRRRRALRGAEDGTRPAGATPRASPWPRPRRGEARCRWSIRWRWARSASPEPAPPTRRGRGRPGASASARACRTSPPARAPCSPTRRASFAQINVTAFDAGKHGALAVVGDAGAVLEALAARARRLSGARGLDARRSQAGRGGLGSRLARGHGRAGKRRRAALRRPGDRRGLAPGAATTPSSSAPPAACRASCTSCGGRSGRAATTWNTASPAWATRSPAASA